MRNFIYFIRLSYEAFFRLSSPSYPVMNSLLIPSWTTFSSSRMYILHTVIKSSGPFQSSNSYLDSDFVEIFGAFLGLGSSLVSRSSFTFPFLSVTLICDDIETLSTTVLWPFTCLLGLMGAIWMLKFRLSLKNLNT